MNIRGKIVLVVLPLIVTPLLFAGLIATLLARNGITGVATQFLQFKAEQVVTYADGQFRLLRENSLDGRPDFRQAAVDAISSFASGVLRSETELIFAVDSTNRVAFAAGAPPTAARQTTRRVGVNLETIVESVVGELGSEPRLGWNRFTLGDSTRVGFALAFDPLDWTVYVTEQSATFYESTTAIIWQIGVVGLASIAIALVLLIVFSGYLTRPLRSVVDAMRQIIETNDLSQRVEVLYRDETGKLAHTFNIMTDQLERAYEHIKSYALRAATARLKEQKTRTMFQKYVPSDVIEQFFANPERMLVGENRSVSILFSDIRDFTSISEAMRPDELVETLNHYFTVMVDTIMSHHGIVDKYIGDAIMALFGTPARRPDDVKHSAYAALDMVDALKDFNVWQRRRGQQPFRIGVGINYGEVTVGNIGTEKKLDYTVIGDMVNVASRLEGLTKRYQTPIVVSETVRESLTDDIRAERVFSRFLDTVQVKGRARGIKVHALARSLTRAEAQVWALHNTGMEFFYDRDFERAAGSFHEALKLIPQDAPARRMERRCRELVAEEPGESWTGIVEMTEK